MKYCDLSFTNEHGETRDKLLSGFYELKFEVDYFEFLFPSQELDALLQSSALRNDSLDIVKTIIIVFLETKNLKLINHTKRKMTFKEKGLFNYFSLASVTIDLTRYTRRNGYMWSDNIYDTLSF